MSDRDSLFGSFLVEDGSSGLVSTRRRVRNPLLLALNDNAKIRSGGPFAVNGYSEASGLMNSKIGYL